MPLQKIVVILERSDRFVPERIQFSTVFYFRDQESLTHNLPTAEAAFLRFLADNKLEHEGPYPGKINTEFEYTYPAYKITLTPASYQLVDKYRDSHPELALTVLNSTFSKRDQEQFLQNTIEAARKKAQEKAQNEGLVLKEGFDFEEISTPKPRWVVGPPLSARYDHFWQPISGHFKFYFLAE